MKKYIYAILILFVFIIANCGGPISGSIPGKITISCADVHNTDQSLRCPQTTARFSILPTAYAATVIDAGDINRGQMINVTQEVTNNTGADIDGWVEMKIDAGCAGAAEWLMIPKMPVTFIAGTTWAITLGGECGDMPLGARTLTATAWQPDGVTEIGQLIVSFNLVK